MKLIVGLGNPDLKYQNTRHQIGANVVDYLANYIYQKKNYGARIGEGKLIREKVLFCVPETGMNLSGSAVAPIMELYGVTPDELWVIHDDIDLGLGEVKVQRNKSHAGHNGVKNIQERLKTRNFNRIRIGVGRPPEGVSVLDWVLGDFSRKDIEVLNKVLNSVEYLIK